MCLARTRSRDEKILKVGPSKNKRRRRSRTGRNKLEFLGIPSGKAFQTPTKVFFSILALVPAKTLRKITYRFIYIYYMKIAPLTYTHQQEQKCKKLQANKASTYRKQQIQTKASLKQPREHNLQTYYGRSLAGGQPGRNFPKERGASEIFLRGPNTRKLQASKASTCKKQQRQTKTSLKQPQEHKKL